MEKNKNDDALNLWSGVFFGVGIVAFLDEAIFHQLLHWHHFYDKATLSVGLISDGLFHAFSWFATVAGLFMLAQLRKRNVWKKQKWIGSLLLGAGVFQLYDGTIQHKLMKIHQIRYNVEIFYYDLTWNVIAILLIIIGIVLIKKKSSIPHQKVGGMNA
ncbi:DUF2243 domain-containing protein [Lysinibacillus sp. BW-2-10]|uniref:DUF2243 domain-containing protein n=1 Tax=Lysinibacillus sp. BW-2-10 TaxID=2590030 RepID=UPI0011806035|nr:DUF2243 domain-containing protein [Lysinibacillus sp. BW-2-10]TSI04499.1 DUF2243 domain-containing protein [Lysinibacillus sp. BW-2-10]